MCECMSWQSLSETHVTPSINVNDISGDILLIHIQSDLSTTC